MFLISPIKYDNPPRGAALFEAELLIYGSSNQRKQQEVLLFP